METRVKLLECWKCGEKLGAVTIQSIGTPHQFFGEPVCVDCLPGEVERMEKEVEKNGLPEDERLRAEEQLEQIQEWLKESLGKSSS